jgi:uncharacterized protein YecE (DUF72 family)
MQTETVTPEQTYYRLHGTTGSRHVHTDDELRRLRDLVDGRPSPYVLFNNLPRTGDAERFQTLLASAVGRRAVGAVSHDRVRARQQTNDHGDPPPFP